MNTQTTMHEPDRVRRHSTAEALKSIDEKIEQNIRFYATQPESVITRRIEELEREWDMERTLETNASIIALSSAFFGLTSSRKWLLLTCTVMGFLFQHATTGWCPPVPMFRRFGVRTRGEIDREKYALKTLRGDFKDVKPANLAAQTSTTVTQVMQAVKP